MAKAKVMSFKEGKLRLRRKCLECGTPRAKLAKAEGFCSYECSAKYEIKQDRGNVAMSILRGRGEKE